MDNLDEAKPIVLKSYESINEINLMTIPFVSMKKQKVYEIDRTWIKSNGDEVGIVVKGSTNGCPTMSDLDVLLGLFKIMLDNMNNKYTIRDNKIEFDRTINFTYNELANVMGYSRLTGNVKKSLEKSIKTLRETTIYSNFAIKDKSNDAYVDVFNGEESCNILSSYKSYSMKRQKKTNKPYQDYKTIKENTCVEIDKFFFDNMCHNYFKIYNYDTYKKLTQGIAKKLFLILSQWSHDSSKFITYRTLYDYIGLDVNDETTSQYYTNYCNRRIKEAVDELKNVGFIRDYGISTKKGVNFIFNEEKYIKKTLKNKYKTYDECYVRLREIGFDFQQPFVYLENNSLEYVSAILRYVDTRKDIKDKKKYVEYGLSSKSYNLDEFK